MQWSHLALVQLSHWQVKRRLEHLVHGQKVQEDKFGNASIQPCSFSRLTCKHCKSHRNYNLLRLSLPNFLIAKSKCVSPARRDSLEKIVRCCQGVEAESMGKALASWRLGRVR